MSVPDYSIGVAGAGRVARALGRFLFEAGEPIVWVASRNPDQGEAAAKFVGPTVRALSLGEVPRATCRVVIAVSDSAITEVAAELAGRCHFEIALHTCGAKGPEALEPLRARGTACGTIHPLQTFASEPGAAIFEGAAFGVWGDELAVQWAESIASLGRGEVLRIPNEFRTFYHAAAVMVSNYVVALVDAGQELMTHAGIDRSAAMRALGPLLRTTVENILRKGPVDALTGPIERGDSETVLAHLEVLSAVPRAVQLLYRAAALQTVDVARWRGLPAEIALHLDQILQATRE